MSEPEPQDPPLLPPWFRAKLFAVLAGYMFVMQYLAESRDDPGLLPIWFGTALPVAWIAAGVWHWVARPAPHRTVPEVFGIWKRAVMRAPGMSLLYAGMTPIALVFAARFAITPSFEITPQDEVLAYVACGVGALAAVVGLVVWLRRSGQQL